MAICGTIVFVYDTEKYYRLKVDDSTGIASVKLWKSCILEDEHSLNLLSNKIIQNSSYSSQSIQAFDRFKPKEVYDMLDAIRKELMDNAVNNSIIFEPRQGDLVLIRGSVQHYK